MENYSGGVDLIGFMEQHTRYLIQTAVMFIFAHCILLSFISLASLECIIDSSTARISREVSLHEDLMKSYTNSKNATKLKNTTVPVTMRLLLKTFQFFNDEEEFLLYSWAFLSWHDERLTWTPADYDDIETSLFNIMHFWHPQIALDSEVAYQSELFDSYYLNCQIFHVGLVACIPKTTYIVPCKSVLDNWPYDTQTCNFSYTVKNNANLSYLDSMSISTLGAEYGTGWTIVGHEYTPPEHLKDRMSFTLTVERTAALLAATNVIPLVVIAVLCLGALFIDVKNTLRVYILCFCLACDLVFLQTINENIPKGGLGKPKLLIFLRNSIVMAAVSLILTFTLKNLRKRTKPTPTWVVQINDFVLKDSRKKFIWPKWEPEYCGDDSINKTLLDWNSFSLVLNYFLLIIYFVTYFISFLIYIPKPIPVTSNI